MVELCPGGVKFGKEGIASRLEARSSGRRYVLPAVVMKKGVGGFASTSGLPDVV